MLKIYSEISQKNKLKGKSLVDLGGLSVSATSGENLDRYWSAVKLIALSNRTEVNFPKPEAYFHPEHLGIVYKSLLGLVLDGYTVEVSTYSSSFLNWVHQDNQIKPTSSSVLSPKSNRTFAKYDFDLVGKRIAIIGLPKSQVGRFESLVLTEKKAEELEFINSSSHNDTEAAPEKLKDFDIVVVVKRFVGHSTINILKSVLGSSSAQLVSSSSHGLDGLERALYRGVKGYPSEEGAIVVDYLLLSR